MNKPSPELLLSKYEIRREVQNIMGKYTLHFCVMREYELMKYWSARADISLAVNDGYFTGQEAVASWYDCRRAEIETASRLIKARFPKELGDKTEEECMGVGQIAYRPIDTPVIEVADDLKTAKGLWVVRGSYNRVTPAGPVSYWDWSYLAADFIEEDGQWKIWHMILFTDIACPLGQNWGSAKMYEHEGVTPPEPTEPGELYKSFGEDYVFEINPEMPEPYDTFANTFSY